MKTDQAIFVTKAQYLKEYQIRLEFNDKKLQTIDFRHFITSSCNPHILKYKDLELFQQFFITNGDLEWNDYDLCFAIDDLYENKNIEASNGGSNAAA